VVDGVEGMGKARYAGRRVELLNDGYAKFRALTPSDIERGSSARSCAFPFTPLLLQRRALAQARQTAAAGGCCLRTTRSRSLRRGRCCRRRAHGGIPT